jgi:cyclase
MNTVRIIPCLDVDGGRVVKGVRFSDLKDAGDPVRLARRYYHEGADELAFLDIGATPNSRNTMLKVVEAVSEAVFVPLTVGGGVRSIEDIRNLLGAGADKVAICTAALNDPGLVARGATRFGSQCIVLSVDAKRTAGGWNAFSGGGRHDSGRDVLDWVQEAVKLGAGEILINSIDRDGTHSGYDLTLTRAVSRSVPVPVIASGGAGNVSDLLAALREGEAEAVLLASILHSGRYSIKTIKQIIECAGRWVRW